MIWLLKLRQKKARTITSGNGKEFVGHEEIANRLKADFCVVLPYSSWKRGTTKNTNGLIRRYFPKSQGFKMMTQQEIEAAMERLNNQPRKRLGYKTLSRVFFEPSVALHI